jgi:serine/threonine protein kinase
VSQLPRQAQASGEWRFSPSETISAHLSARCDVATDSRGAVTVAWRAPSYASLPSARFAPPQDDDETLEFAQHTPAHLPPPQAPRHTGARGEALPPQESGSRPLSASVEVVQKLGEGGMGVVYLAQQSLPHRLIALKRLRDPSPQNRGWLLQELHVTGHLAHPNIIPIYEVREHPTEGLEILMKRVEGRTLLQELGEGPISRARLPWLLSVMVQVCHALEFAHAQGVIHRDIKCENIMIGAFGEVYLMDWGIALILREAAGAHKGVLGTPCYLAPEMLSGDPTHLTPLTDVYLLGATLHHALTGQFRHSATSLQAALNDARASAPADYSPLSGVLPERLTALMNAACDPDPARRPQGVAAVRATLELALDDAKALALCEEARPFLSALHAELSAPSPREQALSVLAAECESRAQSALLVSPTSAEALKLRLTVERALIRLDLLHNAPEQAARRAERLGALLADPELLAQVEGALARKADAARQVSLLNPARSASARRRLLIAMTTGAVLISTGGLIYNHFFAHEVTTRRLLISKSAVFAVIALGTLWGGRALWRTPTGAQLSRALLLGSGLAVFNGLATYLSGGSTRGMMAVDMMIIGVSFAHTEPLVNTGRWAAGLCALCALVSFLSPAFTYPLLLICFVFSPLLALVAWAPATRAR